MYIEFEFELQNAFPVSGLYTTHLLSLDALLTVVESIEARSNLLPTESFRDDHISQSSENEGMRVTIRVAKKNLKFSIFCSHTRLL